jgi:hypothetical protein
MFNHYCINFDTTSFGLILLESGQDSSNSETWSSLVLSTHFQKAIKKGKEKVRFSTYSFPTLPASNLHNDPSILTTEVQCYIGFNISSLLNLFPFLHRPSHFLNAMLNIMVFLSLHMHC